MNAKEIENANNNLIVVGVSEELNEKCVSKSTENIVWGMLQRYYIPQRARIDNDDLCYKCRTCGNAVSLMQKYCSKCGQLLNW